MNRISVFSKEDKFKILEKDAASFARKILKNTEKDSVSVDVFFISGREMRKINKKYRKKDKITNILSFAEPREFICADPKFLKLGEIYICPSLVADYFKISGKKYPAGLLTLADLLIHGILHLLGYDHIKKSDRIIMEKKEEEILRNL